MNKSPFCRHRTLTHSAKIMLVLTVYRQERFANLHISIMNSCMTAALFFELKGQGWGRFLRLFNELIVGWVTILPASSLRRTMYLHSSSFVNSLLGT